MPQTSERLETKTTEGLVRGRIEEGVAVFREIPFAHPPIGALRFKAPVRPQPRSEPLDASGPATICPQLPLRIFTALGEQGGRQDEDCLKLTVWTPAPLGRKRPMVVWLHGGAFMSGGGSIPWYDGARLARDNDIVVVGVNYRLGALGFLCRPGLVEQNLGLLDQLSALAWLRDNAAQLGADPGQVTLMGQSAGAISIACMLALPQARGLFHRAIFLSGGYMDNLPTVEDARAVADRFCANLGIDPNSQDALERLQSVSVEKILEAQLVTMRETVRAAGNAMPIFAPVVGQGLPAGSALELAVQAGAHEIDALVGATAEEMLTFKGLDPRTANLNVQDLPRVAEGLFGVSWSSRINHARRTRPGATPTQLLTDAYSDWLVDTGRRIALAVADGNRKAWLFRFAWRARGSDFGACHCIDLPFVFGSFDAFKNAQMLAGGDRAEMEALSGVLRASIGRFVRDGSPGGADIPHWPPFSRAQPVLMEFGSLLHLGWLEQACVARSGK
jgi:para-nitrobenzyl esterase